MSKKIYTEVTFKTHKQLWLDLKKFCHYQTQETGNAVLIKDIASTAIREHIDRKNDYIYMPPFLEYKSLKKKYKYAKYCLLLLGSFLGLICIALFLCLCV